MRCGCTSIGQQCPPCPETEFVDHLNLPGDPGVPIDFIITTLPASTQTDLLVRVFSVPAGLPGFGVAAIADFAGCAGSDQNDITVAWEFRLDGVLLGTARLVNVHSDECESFALVGSQNNITPGNHTLTLHLTMFSTQAGTKHFFINGAAMDTRLVRATNLTVTGTGP